MAFSEKHSFITYSRSDIQEKCGLHRWQDLDFVKARTVESHRWSDWCGHPGGVMSVGLVGTAGPSRPRTPRPVLRRSTAEDGRGVPPKKCGRFGDIPYPFLARWREGVIIFINETCAGGFGLFADWPGPERGHPAPARRQAVAVRHRLPRLRRRIRQDRVHVALSQ